MTVNAFRKEMYRNFKAKGRDFPWRRTQNPYRIMVSEVMLQQTQAARVIEKYQSFLRIFPSVRSLARAPFPRVLHAWQGLGYNRRALHLHRAAKEIVARHRGLVPSTVEELETLPGIGRNTAGAICAFAFNKPAVFVETNIRTVFIHFFFLRAHRVKDSQILASVQATLDRKRPREWYLALMDYGAMLKRTVENPNRKSAHYKKQSAFAGSVRQTRGAMLRLLIERKRASAASLMDALKISKKRFDRVAHSLVAEGFIEHRSDTFRLAHT